MIEVIETERRLVFKIWNKGSEKEIFADLELTYGKKSKTYKIRRKSDKFKIERSCQEYFEYLLLTAGADITRYLDLRYLISQ